MNTSKIAVVTGASRGIGAAISRRLASDGFDIVLHYGTGAAEVEKAAAEVRQLGRKAWVVQADFTAKDAAQQLIAGLDKHGIQKLDALINNAGVAPFASVADTDEATFDSLMAINVRSLFMTTRALLARLNDGGRIINLSSLVTRTVFPGTPAYSASKGFVDVFTLHLAAELGPRQITVNAVSPGAIDTRMSAWIHGEGGKETLASIQTLSGIGQPEHVAGVVAFLAGKDGAWTTGQIVDVSGGTKL
jgi:3-oxoacyl-[acyl-carrier protein] reductase